MYQVDGVLSVLSAYNAAGTTGCSGSPPTCQPLWTTTTGPGTRFSSSATVTGGVVYVMANTQSANVLFAFDATGQQGCIGPPTVCAPLWTATFDGAGENQGGSSPAVANGLVYTSGADHTVYVFDAAGQQNCSGTPKECSALWTATVPLPCPSSQSPCGLCVPTGRERHALRHR